MLQAPKKTACYVGKDPHFARKLQDAVGTDVTVISKKPGEPVKFSKYHFVVVDSLDSVEWPQLVKMLTGKGEKVLVIVLAIHDEGAIRIAKDNGALGTLASYFTPQQIQTSLQAHQLI